MVTYGYSTASAWFYYRLQLSFIQSDRHLSIKWRVVGFMALCNPRRITSTAFTSQGGNLSTKHLILNHAMIGGRGGVARRLQQNPRKRSKTLLNAPPLSFFPCMPVVPRPSYQWRRPDHPQPLEHTQRAS